MIYSENRVPLFGIMLSSSLPLPYGRSPRRADGPSHPAGHHVRYTGMAGRRTCMFQAGTQAFSAKSRKSKPKTGSARDATRIEAPHLSRNSVKLRLTLHSAGALLFPRPHSVQRRRMRLSGRTGPSNANRPSERSRRAARLIAEPLDESLSSIERGKPRFHIDQTRVVGFAVVLAKRQFRVLKFPS